MDDQRTDREECEPAELRVGRIAFTLRQLFVLVAVCALLFTVIGWRLKVHYYDIDARRMSLQGRLVFLEKLRKHYDEIHVDKHDSAYEGLEKHMVETNRQLKETD